MSEFACDQSYAAPGEWPADMASPLEASGVDVDDDKLPFWCGWLESSPFCCCCWEMDSTVCCRFSTSSVNVNKP